ncbi:MAG: hypothetical protein JW967_01800 [Dehalococcoidales bacterium]|nr:hypothetical protein [Dehalococcoidales bacterium]
MEELSIADAAKRLGTSVDTIRRRISKGELKARKVASPHGEMYLVEIPDDAFPPPESPPSDNAGELQALRKTIAILETELESRRREVSELHILLQRATSSAPKPSSLPWWRRLLPSGKNNSVSA